MARSGVGAQLTVATEAEYGVFTKGTRAYQLESESLALDKEIIRNQGLRAGRFAQPANLHRATTRTVAGDVGVKLYDQGMGILFDQLHGNEVEPEKVEEKSEEVYKQVHAIGLSDPFEKSLMVQVGRPDTGSTTRAFSYLGCKVVSLGLSVEAQGEAMLSVGVDGQDEGLEEELDEPTYDADARPFLFQDVEVKLAGSKAANYRSVSMNIEVPYAVDRYNLGNSGTKLTPIMNGLVAVTFDAEAEFASLADHNRFVNQTDTKVELIATGTEIGEEGETFLFKATAPLTRLVSSAPTVDGPDIITSSLSFEALDNGSEAPLTVEMRSTDSAL